MIEDPASLDLFSRHVVGWATSATNDRALALDALELALRARRPTAGLLHHVMSPRGRRDRGRGGALPAERRTRHARGHLRARDATRRDHRAGLRAQVSAVDLTSAQSVPLPPEGGDRPNTATNVRSCWQIIDQR
jgi:hypothetical protein